MGPRLSVARHGGADVPPNVLRSEQSADTAAEHTAQRNTCQVNLRRELTRERANHTGVSLLNSILHCIHHLRGLLRGDCLTSAIQAFLRLLERVLRSA